MASDSSSGFWQGYHTFLYGHIKYNREGGRKNKRTNMELGQLQAQERELLTLCILRASVDSHRCVFYAKPLEKPLGMPTHLWLSSLTASFCWPPWTPTGLFCSPLSTCPLCLLFVNCPSVYSGDLPFLLYFQSRGRSRPQAPLFVFCRQRDSLTGAHTHPTQWMAT